MTDHEINILEKGAHSPSLFMKETSRGWTTKAGQGTNQDLESQAAASRDLQFVCCWEPQLRDSY